MTSGRRKNRTHVREAENAPDQQKDKKEHPKSFVIRSGADISRPGHQLVRDLRRVMEPNTASRLRERKANKLKDYLAMAGPLGVTHIAMVSETEETMNLRLGKFPRGPTLYLRVLKYCLAKDCRAAQRHPKPPGLEFSSAPLLVLNNFDVEGRPEHKLLVTFLQSYYPTMSAAKMRLTDLRRVVLYSYDESSDTLLFRHFLIRIKGGSGAASSSAAKLVKRIVEGKLVGGMSECGEIGDLLDIQNTAAASDSEPDDDAMVTLGQRYLGKGNEKAEQRSVHLQEIGPRLTLRMVKIEDGLNEGRVLYHVPGKEE